MQHRSCRHHCRVILERRDYYLRLQLWRFPLRSSQGTFGTRRRRSHAPLPTKRHYPCARQWSCCAEWNFYPRCLGPPFSVNGHVPEADDGEGRWICRKAGCTSLRLRTKKFIRDNNPVVMCTFFFNSSSYVLFRQFDFWLYLVSSSSIRNF